MFQKINTRINLWFEKFIIPFGFCYFIVAMIIFNFNLHVQHLSFIIFSSLVFLIISIILSFQPKLRFKIIDYLFLLILVYFAISSLTLYISNAYPLENLIKFNIYVLPFAFLLGFVILIRNRPSIKKIQNDNLISVFKKVELITLLLLIVCTSYFYIHLALNYIGNDEASYIYDSILINQGAIPFKDFVTRAPSVLYIYDFLFKFVPNTLDLLKLISLTIFGSTVFFLYKTLQFFFSKKTSVWSIIVFLSSIILIMPIIVTSTIILNSFYLIVFTYCYLTYLKTSNKKILLVSGLWLSLACLARPIGGLIFLFLLISFIFEKKWKEIMWFNMGFVPIPILSILYFGYYIGLKTSIFLLTGLGSLVTTEAKKASSYNIWLLDLIKNNYLIAISIGLVGFSYVFWKRFKDKKWQIVNAWFLGFFIFYSYYVFKRGAGLGYMFEVFLPFIFYIGMFFEKFFSKSKLTTYLIIFILILNQSLVAFWVGTNTTNLSLFQKLIGSGISTKDEKIIASNIELNSNENDRILAGSLQWAIDSQRRQYNNLSHPLVFENGSQISNLYKISRESLTNAVINDPPEIIVKDDRYDLAFYYLPENLFDSYKEVYSLNNEEIWILSSSTQFLNNN